MGENQARPMVWMLVGSLFFAVMGGLAHSLGARCDWRVVALTRALVMLVSAAAMARAAGVPLAVFRPRSLWMRSLAGSFSLVCNFYALARLPVGDVLTLTNAYPLWIVLMTAAAARRAPSLIEALGVACGMVGVVLIQQQPDLAADDRGALVVAVVSSFSTAVAMFGLHRLRGVDARAVMAHFAGVASLVAGVWCLAPPGFVGPRTFEPATIALLLGVGLTGTAGQYCLTKAFAGGPPGRVSVVSFSQVAFGLLFDVLIWGETATLRKLAGMALVLAPTCWLVVRGAGRRRLPAGPTAIARTAEPEGRRV
jgi:drug/metabolite transporter (DMT)-like permease